MSNGELSRLLFVRDPTAGNYGRDDEKENEGKRKKKRKKAG